MEWNEYRKLENNKMKLKRIQYARKSFKLCGSHWNGLNLKCSDASINMKKGNEEQKENKSWQRNDITISIPFNQCRFLVRQKKIVFFQI